MTVKTTDTDNKYAGLGGGEVIPPARARATHGPLEAGKDISVRILDVFDENRGCAHPAEIKEGEPAPVENWEVRVLYPSGLQKGHQQPKGSDAALLIGKIRNQLRGMHGGEKTGELKTQLPAKVEDLKNLTLVFEGDK